MSGLGFKTGFKFQHHINKRQLRTQHQPELKSLCISQYIGEIFMH